MNTKLNFVDLFAGAGGLSKGFTMAGFNQVFAIDINKDACNTYKHNFPKHFILQQNICQLNTKDIKKLVNGKKIDVIIGGPPCQGFSIAGNIGRNFVNDPRNYLFKEFVRVVSIVKPKFVVLENVARLNVHNNGKTKKEIIKSFKDIGYSVDCKVLCSADYGVPQVRNRFILIGNKFNKKNKFPKTKHSKTITIKEAIDDLPKLKSGEDSKIPNHKAMNHKSKMLEKMSYITDGGNRNQIPSIKRPLTGDSRKYIRYNSLKPAVCVTGDMRKIFHYSQNRALTVRELARLQSFNDDFVFLGNSISQQQQVGDAVPPLFAKAIAEAIKEMNK